MYVKVENGQIAQYPYTIGNLRKDNPRTSFPKVIFEETLAEFDVYPVTEASVSYDPATQIIAPNAQPSLVDGKWVLGFSIIELTPEQIEAKAQEKLQPYKNAVQRLLDSTAIAKGYDSILSMCTYANSTNASWAAEGQAAVNWRDACWNESLVQMGNYLATGNKPSMEDFLAAMPTPVWPE